jgi:CDP-glucose 4,6-dehydratase
LESVVVIDGFWRNRRVFVTGHTGFKGSWLALLLNELGASVVGYALPAATKPNLFELARVAETMQSVVGDVRDVDRLVSALLDATPEIVLHLAAQSLVRHSYDDPVGTFSTNVAGTVNLLEACRSARSVRAVVVVTSDKCYEENAARLPYKESDPLGGHDPYRRSFFDADDSVVAVATARAGNVIGGGDWATDRLIPDLINAFSAGLQPCLRNPAATRPWQHVLDPLWGYLVLAERLHAEGGRVADAWNFGPVAGASWALAMGTQPREAPMLTLDASKAQQRLGWHPRFDLNTALDWTVSWYKNWHQGGDTRALVLEQIHRFMEGRLQ